MAKGKKTGGRDFQKGNLGKPTGAKDTVPRSVRKSIKAIYENILTRSGAEVEKGIERRLKRGDFLHVKLAAEYLDGKPVTQVEVSTPQAIRFVVQMPDGTERRL